MATQIKPTGQSFIREQVGKASQASQDGRHADALLILERAKSNAKRAKIWGDNKISATLNFLIEEEKLKSA